MHLQGKDGFTPLSLLPHPQYNGGGVEPKLGKHIHKSSQPQYSISTKRNQNNEGIIMIETEENHREADLLNEEEGEEKVDAERENEREPLVHRNI